MRVDEIMTRDPISVEVTATVQDAVDRMFAADIRHLPVVRDGALAAIISDRDVRSYVLPPDEQLVHPDEARSRLEVPITEITQDDVISVGPDTEVSELVDLMIDEKIGAVPVVEQKTLKLLGIVSYIDVLRVARDNI